MTMNVGSSELHHGDPELMLEMNTTPLIDVMLVLLVMLIITIPLNMHAVNVELPKPSNEQPPVLPKIINIKITANRQLRVNNEVISTLAYEAMLEQAAKEFNQPEIHFLPEPGAVYDDVIRAMAIAQRLNLKQIGIPTFDTFASAANP